MLFTKLNIVGFVLAALIATTAQAESTKLVTCSWGTLASSSFPGGWVSVSGCFVEGINNGQPIAQRTIKSNGSCSVSPSYPGATIEGSCSNPIVRVPSLVRSGQCGSYGNYDYSCWNQAQLNCPAQYHYFSTQIDGSWQCFLK